ncbi:MAG: GMC family oxidoreductase N-terminal domain-containing protein [Verrucomicrobia bacterium]|nr:GMC family oxidoreductase N-terminal domain-containing protein [Verrucomicrobiota bacterium]
MKKFTLTLSLLGIVFQQTTIHAHENNVFDFVVVGAGNAGCVIANRLSENGKYSVCLVEYGRDDARAFPPATQILPVRSTANVPQPGDYNWGLYTRGSPAIFEFPAVLIARGFGHFAWFQKEDASGPSPFRSTVQERHSGWGGCTSHNFTFSIRNAPYNWAQWVALGLTDWDASTPTSNMIQFYEKVENRSQLIAPGAPFYDSTLPEPDQGSFPNPQEWYGYNGKVPLINFGPAFLGVNPYTAVLLAAIQAVLPGQYPNQLIDLDWPPTALVGGLSNNNFSQTYQNGFIVPPGQSAHVPFADYNRPLYGDNGFVYPPEMARLGLVGSTTLQRASSANTYLYEALNRNQGNLKVLSESLVTGIIIEKGRAKGVKYLQGYNIYQTGRNVNAESAGYGGSAGDAKANAIKAEEEGEKFVFARKEVIICAGAFNSPQILQLSGVGNKNFLKSFGIRVVSDVPGVGQHLIDNHELFLFWHGTNPGNVWTHAARSSPSQPFPNFDIIWGTINNMPNESRDAFVQKRWSGLKNLPAIYQPFARNDFENILLDSSIAEANLPSIVPTAAAVAPVTGSNLFSVTFTIPVQGTAPPAGAYVIADSVNPTFNGTFYSSATTTTSITLTYQSDPGTFVFSPTTTIDPPAFFSPVIVDNAFLNSVLIEQEENNFTEGHVNIVSKDPTVPPEIIMNYLQDPRDLAVWLETLNNIILPMMLELKATPYFTELADPAPHDFLQPGVTYATWNSVAQVDQDRLTQFLYNRVGGHHAGGTCKMGVTDKHNPLYDPMAVVDQKGRVKGVKGLRVCDASIFPVSIRWPNITLYVIAEKIAADILAENQ